MKGMHDKMQKRKIKQLFRFLDRYGYTCIIIGFYLALAWGLFISEAIRGFLEGDIILGVGFLLIGMIMFLSAIGMLLKKWKEFMDGGTEETAFTRMDKAMMGIRMNACDDEFVKEEEMNQLDRGSKEIYDILYEKVMKDENKKFDSVIVYAAGLAGYACHKVVKKTSDTLFSLVETKDGKVYYLGEAINKLLLENKYSVYRFAAASYMMATKSNEHPGVLGIVKDVAEAIGDDAYRIRGIFHPGEVYIEVQKLYNGVCKEVINEYCNAFIEQEILFASALSYILLNEMKNKEPEQIDELFNTAMEVACMISKMDNDSI